MTGGTPKVNSELSACTGAKDRAVLAWFGAVDQHVVEELAVEQLHESVIREWRGGALQPEHEFCTAGAARASAVEMRACIERGRRRHSPPTLVSHLTLEVYAPTPDC